MEEEWREEMRRADERLMGLGLGCVGVEQEQADLRDRVRGLAERVGRLERATGCSRKEGI